MPFARRAKAATRAPYAGSPGLRRSRSVRTEQSRNHMSRNRSFCDRGPKVRCCSEVPKGLKVAPGARPRAGKARTNNMDRKRAYLVSFALLFLGDIAATASAEERIGVAATVR